MQYMTTPYCVSINALEHTDTHTYTDTHAVIRRTSAIGETPIYEQQRAVRGDGMPHATRRLALQFRTESKPLASLRPKQRQKAEVVPETLAVATTVDLHIGSSRLQSWLRLVFLMLLLLFCIYATLQTFHAL